MAGEQQRSFMIVDENQNNALFWEMAIREMFPDVQTQVCKTGFEALDTAKRNKYDFFVASWELQPMSGLIFMQKLKQIFKYRHTPILIFSQLLSEEDLALAQDFGITNYLLKPFDKQKVIEKIQGMIDAETNLDNTQRLLRKIEDWINENKINECLKVINDVLKPGPHAARAYTLNGDVWARTDYLDKAEIAYKEAIKQDPKYAAALNGLGKLYLKMRKYNDAIQIFETLNQRAPKNLERMVNLGSAYLGNGQDDKAEAVFKQVKNIDGENAEASEGLGKVEFQRGNMELAARFFQESGKGDELASYFNNVGIAMVSQGKHDEAIAHYKNAISVMPERTRVHLLEFNIALAYSKSNRFGDATDAFARSLMGNPKYEKAYQGMALCMREAQAKQQKFNNTMVQQAARIYRETKEGTAGEEESAEQKPDES